MFVRCLLVGYMYLNKFVLKKLSNKYTKEDLVVITFTV